MRLLSLHCCLRALRLKPAQALILLIFRLMPSWPQASGAELEQSQRAARKLEELNQAAYELATRSNERPVELTRLSDETSGTIERLIERQRRIEELAFQLIDDNRRLRELFDRSAGIR